MADPRNSRRVSSSENYFPHAVRRAFPPQLKLKHKKCAPPRPRCVYMRDRCSYVSVERGGALYMDHLLTTYSRPERNPSGVFAREEEGYRGMTTTTTTMTLGITATSRVPAFHRDSNSSVASRNDDLIGFRFRCRERKAPWFSPRLASSLAFRNAYLASVFVGKHCLPSYSFFRSLPASLLLPPTD